MMNNILYSFTCDTKTVCQNVHCVQNKKTNIYLICDIKKSLVLLATLLHDKVIKCQQIVCGITSLLCSTFNAMKCRSVSIRMDVPGRTDCLGLGLEVKRHPS